MANHSNTDFNIPSPTGDYGTDGTLFQVQSTLTPTFDFKEFQATLGNLTGTQVNITKSLRSGWLTGRRPVTGQLFPRGVYNK